MQCPDMPILSPAAVSEPVLGGDRGGRERRNVFYTTGQAGWMRNGRCVLPYQQQAPNSFDSDAEKKLLENQARALRTEPDTIERRIEEIQDVKSGRQLGGRSFIKRPFYKALL